MINQTNRDRKNPADPYHTEMTAMGAIAQHEILHHVARGPIVIETIWWPREQLSLGLVGRASPDQWRDDLREHGVRAGDVVEFVAEDVVDRFQLTVNDDGGFRTDPIALETRPGTLITTDEGDTAATIEELIGIVYASAERTPWLFPLDYRCRVSIVRAPINLQLVYRGDDAGMTFEAKDS
jgi:hypothetical protein